MKNKNLIFSVLVILVFGFIGFYVVRNAKVVSNEQTPTPVVKDISLSVKYISSVNPWPPKVAFENGELVCNESGTEITENGQTTKKMITGKQYCITVRNEGAAGSTYTYTAKINGALAKTTFVLRSVQCGNYNDPEKTECENERNNFNVDNLANDIIENAL